MNTDPADLANLRGLALPPPVPWWPPPAGWWILAAGILAITAMALVRLWRRYHANAYRRAALRELAALPLAAGAPAIAELLKRTALAAYPRTEVAALSGAAWLAFLDRTGNTADFTRGASRALPDAACGAALPFDHPAVIACVRRWIKGHRRC
jgi:hypothetical protein